MRIFGTIVLDTCQSNRSTQNTDINRAETTAF